MFDIGAPELLVVAVVLIVIVGPKDLPKMLRAFGKTTTKLRAMAGDFRRQFDDALKEAELDEVASTVSSMRKIDPLAEVKKELNPLASAGKQIHKDLEEAIKPDLKVMDPPTVAPEKPVAPAKPKGPVNMTTPKKAASKAPATKKPAAKKASAPRAKTAAKPAQTARKAAPKAKKPAAAKAKKPATTRSRNT